MTAPTNDPGERPELKTYLVEFGDRLETAERREGALATAAAPAVGPAPARAARRRWRRPLAGVAGLAVAGLAAAFIVVPAITPVDPVSEARAALGDPGDLVHFVIVPGQAPGPSEGSPCMERRPIEVWQATSGTPRWRVLLPGMAKRCGMMATWDGTRTPGPTEMARDDDTQTTWYPQIRRLEVLTETGYPESSGYPEMLIGAPEPGGAAAASGDPIQRLRALLDQGTLREGRRSRIGGREVVHLVGATKAGKGSSESQFDLAVDAATYAPVRFTTRYLSDFLRLNPGVGASVDGWVTYTTEFVTYEQRPMTAQAAQELTIRPATKPKTEFRFTKAEFERRVKANRGR